VEYLFVVAGAVIVFLYGYRLLNNLKSTLSENKKMTFVLLFYYASIMLYTLSMVVVPIAPVLSEPLGGAGFGAMILSFGAAFYFKEFFLQGEKISVFEYLKRYKDRSLLMIVIYLIFTAYLGLTKFNIIPQLYSAEFPQGYIELVNQAESGVEKPVNGVYKHEAYKSNLNKFLERNADKK